MLTLHICNIIIIYLIYNKVKNKLGVGNMIENNINQLNNIFFGCILVLK